MACAKLQPDCIYKTNITVNIIFTKFQLCIYKMFVKWYSDVAVRMIWTNKIYFPSAFKVLFRVIFFLMHHISCDEYIYIHIYKYLYPTNALYMLILSYKKYYSPICWTHLYCCGITPVVSQDKNVPWMFDKKMAVHWDGHLGCCTIVDVTT